MHISQHAALEQLIAAMPSTYPDCGVDHSPALCDHLSHPKHEYLGPVAAGAVYRLWSANGKWLGVPQM
jgi:hypothetical protein